MWGRGGGGGGEGDGGVGDFGLRIAVDEGVWENLGNRRVRGVCLRFASPFGQSMAGYLPSVGSRSDDGYLGGDLVVGERLEDCGLRRGCRAGRGREG